VHIGVLNKNKEQKKKKEKKGIINFQIPSSRFGCLHCKKG
jgi:hypothetical protein